MSDFFLTERGVRQGDPLSLLLYVFVAEVLALLVRADDGIEGISLPGSPKPLKIQQYADDFILFTKSGKSVESFFQKVDIFQKASGSVINVLKTRGLALGGFDPTTDTRLTDVTWTNNTGIKILGVTFYTRLNQTTNFNRLTALNKTDKNLNILGLRLVSLRGKAMLLNTLALSKIWFLANTLPIPEWVVQRLQTTIFENLWQKQRFNPIKKNTLFLPTRRLLSPKEQCFAIRHNTLFQMRERNTEDIHDCYYLTKYWLASSLVKFTDKNPNWNFLRKNNFLRHWDNKTSQYYQTTLQYLTEHQLLFEISHKTCKSLYTKITKNKKIVVASELYWSRITKTNLPWTLIWKRNFTLYAHGPTQNVLFPFST